MPGKTLLVVDDEDGVCRLASRILTAAGYTVLSAMRADEALIHARTDGCSIDLVVSDVRMPSMDGPALAELLVSQFGVTRVLFISGYSGDRRLNELNDQATVGFLPKPFTPGELLSAVESILNDRRLR